MWRKRGAKAEGFGIIIGTISLSGEARAGTRLSWESGPRGPAPKASPRTPKHSCPGRGIPSGRCAIGTPCPRQSLDQAGGSLQLDECYLF